MTNYYQKNMCIKNYKLQKWFIKFWFILHIIQIPALFMIIELWPEYTIIIIGLIGLTCCWMFWFIPHMIIKYQRCNEIERILSSINSDTK